MDLEELQRDTDLLERAFNKLAEDPSAYEALKRAKELGDTQAMQGYLLDAAAKVQDEAINYRTALAQEQSQFAQDTLATAAIGLGAGMAGSRIASSLGQGGKTAGLIGTALDVGGNAIYDATVRGLPAKNVLTNAGISTATDLLTLGAGEIGAKVFDRGYRGNVIKAAQGRGQVLAPIAQQGSAGAKNAATTDFINPRMADGDYLPTNEELIVRSQYFSPERNLYDPQRLSFQSGQVPGSTAKTLVDIKRDAATSAITSIQQEKQRYLPVIEAVYSAARGSPGSSLRGVRLRDILSPELLESIRSNSQWSFTNGKAASALASLEELAGDIAKLNGLSDPKTHAAVFKSYVLGGKSASGLENAVWDAELSPAQANELLRKIQNTLVEAGSYDAKLKAALRQNNPSNSLIDGDAPIDLELAKKLEPKLQEQLARVERDVRTSPVAQNPQFYEILAGKEPDWLSQANKAQHSFIRLNSEYIEPLQGQAVGGQAGSAINAIPTSSQGAFDAAGKQVLNVWGGSPSVRGMQQAEDKFLEAAMLADAKLNPHKYDPATRHQMLRAGILAGNNTLMNMTSYGSPRMDRTTAAAESDPRGFADKIVNHMLTKGAPPEIAFQLGTEAFRIFSKEGALPEKQKVMGQYIMMVPEVFVPTSDGLSSVYDGRINDPLEQSMHLRNALEEPNLVKEASVISGGLHGKYVPIRDPKPQEETMEVLQDPIDFEFLDGAFQMPSSDDAMMSYPAIQDPVKKLEQLSGDPEY